MIINFIRKKKLPHQFYQIEKFLKKAFFIYIFFKILKTFFYFFGEHY